MLRAMANKGVLGRIAVAFVALLAMSAVAMYLVNPFHSPLHDPSARILGVALYRAPSLSMAPTVPEGALFMVNTAVLGSRDPRPGEMVVFLYPPDPRVTYLKRIVAVGGNTIEMRGKKVYVDGRELDEPYVPARPIVPPVMAGLDLDAMNEDLPPFKVPEGEYFVLGDNRLNSQDSRHWGTVPRELMVGVFSRILFQPDESAKHE